MHRDTPYIVVILCILWWVSIYTTSIQSNSISTLSENYIEIAGRIASLEIQSDDAIQQQRRMLIDIYSSQIQEAKSIASQAWFDYDNLIFVDISWINMNVVRLANWRKDWELEVNIQSKVITKF